MSASDTTTAPTAPTLGAAAAANALVYGHKLQACAGKAARKGPLGTIPFKRIPVMLAGAACSYHEVPKCWGVKLVHRPSPPLSPAGRPGAVVP